MVLVPVQTRAEALYLVMLLVSVVFWSVHLAVSSGDGRGRLSGSRGFPNRSPSQDCPTFSGLVSLRTSGGWQRVRAPCPGVTRCCGWECAWSPAELSQALPRDLEPAPVSVGTFLQLPAKTPAPGTSQLL